MPEDSPNIVARFTIPGEPVSKSRARFTGRGSKTRAYTPEKTKHAEQVMAGAFRQASPDWLPNAERAFSVVVAFYHGTMQRRDVDNMLKLVLDGLNEVAWADDTQVTEVHGRKDYTTKEDARTEVAIYDLGITRRLMATCEACGEEYRTYLSWKNKRYCSDDCRMKLRRAARRRTCETCGIEWDPGKPSTARFCSRGCSTNSQRVELHCSHCDAVFTRRKSYVRPTNYCSAECMAEASKGRKVKIPKGKCTVCGEGVSRREYLRCNACKLKGAGVKGAPRLGALSVEANEGIKLAYVTPAGRVVA